LNTKEWLGGAGKGRGNPDRGLGKREINGDAATKNFRSIRKRKYKRGRKVKTSKRAMV